MLFRQYEATLSVRVGNGRLTAESVENGCVICGISLGVRMSDRLGAMKGDAHRGARPGSQAFAIS